MVQVATDVIHPVLVTMVDGALPGMLKMLLSVQPPGLSRIYVNVDSINTIYIYIYIYLYNTVYNMHQVGTI